MHLQDGDVYRIRVVRQDLEFIRDELRNEISESALRRSSTTLRSLLVEGGFGRAWRSLGLERQPIIPAPDFESVVSGYRRDLIEFAQTGGALYKGIKLTSLVQVNYAATLDEIRERARRGPFAAMRDFPLTNLLESACLIFKGSVVNRRELIQYIANKLGGAHIDTKRDESKDLDRRFKEIDELQRGMKVLDISPCYFELLSIGQAVAASPDTERYLSVAANLGDA